jgi:HK97 gp10 family phage protein
MKFRLDLRGEKELLANLNALAKKEAAKAIRKGVRAGGKVFLDGAKAYVPKDEGDLKKSIKLRVSKKKRKGEYAMRVQTTESAIDAGDEFYGRMLEYGTSNMPARPWMRPMFMNMKNTAASIATRIIRAEIEAAANKAAK